MEILNIVLTTLIVLQGGIKAVRNKPARVQVELTDSRVYHPEHETVRLRLVKYAHTDAPLPEDEPSVAE